MQLQESSTLQDSLLCHWQCEESSSLGVSPKSAARSGRCLDCEVVVRTSWAFLCPEGGFPAANSTIQHSAFPSPEGVFLAANSTIPHSAFPFPERVFLGVSSTILHSERVFLAASSTVILVAALQLAWKGCILRPAETSCRWPCLQSSVVILTQVCQQTW